ncbi:MAG: DNA polymerase IV [Treponema sp.]|nr:DNA polymerase IV [Treponema sp.]
MSLFLHADLDAFFASVELLDHPEWRGKPVIVGGLPTERRSVVSTASYEARKYGVHSAMPTATAYKLCPNGIFVHGRMQRYCEISAQIMSIFAEYSPDVQQISIDEAFIDLTGTEKLFGPANETAIKIKKRIFEETALTVSIGLAPTKYLAKLASEVNKPDGFFCIEQGKETDFMLNLPLPKVWGIGQKSLAVLNSKGIYTTKQIYDKSLSLLVSLFGSSFGQFLYNCVRGQELETFNHTIKNHSLSAENTYAWDLHDRNAIDTALLELSHTVVFRMLREKVMSSTVAVKIRYDDFTTVSIQETTDREVATVDDLFERAKLLFYKKYDTNRGIRLLGISLNNTESSLNPRQADLFDFGNEKKRRVEKAILEARQKDPKLKITKARLLPANSKTPLILFLIAAICTFVNVKPVFARETTKNADGAAAIVFDKNKVDLYTAPDRANSTSLFNYSINDRNVEFIAEGYWKSMVSGGLSFNFGYGTTPGYSITTPVLTTKTDLSLWFFLDKKYYFEADFADDFEKNTIAAGYYGNGCLKHARVANRGIRFPAIYSIDRLGLGIGGGDNESPGVSLNFSDDSWQSDFTIRYDRLSAQEKSWHGKNLVNTETIELTDYLTGFRYILPSSPAVLNIKNIYVEASDGAYHDKNGRSYNKLDSTKYLLSANTNSIFLTRDAKASKSNGVLPSIAVEYNSTYSSKALSELGSYGTSEHPGSGFLGEKQSSFDRDLSAYSLPLQGSIDGNEVFYIQYPKCFSPYAYCARYDAGIYTEADASIVNKSTLKSLDDFSAVVNDDTYAFISEDFFNSTHSYVEISSQTTTEEQFPFVNIDCSIYLSQSNSTDLALALKTYNAVSRYEIGTNAVPGTITAYINGIQTEAFTFDEETGCINFAKVPSSSDRVYVQWYEDKTNDSTSSLVLAFGAKKLFSEKLNMDISLASRWAVSAENNYIDSGESSPGHATIASGIEYKTENFNFTNTLGASLKNSNTTGTYLISDMDDSQSSTVYMAKDSGKTLSSSITPALNERDYSSSIILESDNQNSIESQNGVHDTEITGYAIPVEWDFSGISSDATSLNPYWAALNIRLNNTSTLAGAKSFSIALKQSGVLSSDTQIYLQLGVNCDTDASSEDSGLVPTWKISADSLTDAGGQVITPFVLNQDGWQTVSVLIEETDRPKLSVYDDARIIITGTSKNSGIIFAGPYESEHSDFYGSTDGDGRLYTHQSRLSSDNYAQVFELKSSSAQTFSLSRYYDEFDLENYKKLVIRMSSCDFDNNAVNDNCEAVITLDRPKSDGSFEKAARIELDSTQLKKLSSLKNLTIDLQKKNVNYGTLAILDKDISPTRLLLEYTTDQNTIITVDKISLEGALTNFMLNERAAASYQYKTAKIAANANAATTTSANGTFKEGLLYGSVLSSVNLAGFDLEAELGRSGDSDILISNAAHKIKTSKNIFGVLGFSEEYSFDNDAKDLQKENQAAINLTRIKIPLTIQAKSSSSLTENLASQQINSSINFNSKYFINKTALKLNQKANPKKTAAEIVNDRSFENYFTGLKDSFQNEFSTGLTDASLRKTALNNSTTINFPYAKFSPVFYAGADSSYKNTNSTLFTDKAQLRLSLPFSFKSNSISFVLEKTSGSVKNKTAGGSYSKDLEYIKENLQERTWYFKSVPFADLFDSALSDSVFNNASKTSEYESVYYTAAYRLNWKRAFLGNATDFFVPNGASLIFERDIKAASSLSDYYLAKTLFNFSAINVFGTKGFISLFDFYETDEYTTSLTFTLKKAKATSDSTMLLDLFHQNCFYFTKEAVLQNGFDISFEDKNNLHIKWTSIYKRPGSSSLLQDAVKVFASSYKKEDSSLSRSDGINFSYSRASSNTTSDNSSVTENISLEYLHDLNIQLNRYATLNTSINGQFDCTVESVVLVNVNASIGATIKF